jgi:membrane-bound lytic murein transglycosylase A
MGGRGSSWRADRGASRLRRPCDRAFGSLRQASHAGPGRRPGGADLPRGVVPAGAPARRGPADGLFHARYPARATSEPPYAAPLRPLSDLAAIRAPAPDRAAIEAAPAPSALAWLKPEDLYLLQIQGSGVLVLPRGRRLKATYAGSNGLGYVALGTILQAEGQIAPGAASAEAVHAWLAAHRGAEADALMRRNPRYIFFALAEDDGRPPVGAAGVPLPAGRAAAVDPERHAMGELLWIEADRPLLAGARPGYARLVAALDTGAAIKGEVRADLYLGQGPEAGAEASKTRHRLRLYRLVPRTEGRP